MFDRYPDYEYLCASVQLICFMLGMGATLTGHDFAFLLRQPKFLLVGAAGQLIVSPLVAMLVAHWGGLEPGLAVGLLLVAAMPGGTLSKVFTYLGKGNIALSIALTVFGTLACVGTVPLVLRFLADEQVPAGFAMPVGWILRDLTLYLLLPLAVGMGVARLAPVARRPFSKWCIRAGWVVVIVMIVGSVGSGRVHPAEYGLKGPLAIIVFCLLAQQLSMLPFRVLGWPRANCLSVGIEVTLRNLNLALLLKALLFPAVEKGVDAIADGVLFVILAYAPVGLCIGIPLALNFRRLAKRDAARTSCVLAQVSAR
jgi:BASS family bile acid:Na+ symporter